MSPDLNQIDFYKVLFWVIIVLVAGFIGQFGKSFATFIMNRFRKKPPGVSGPERPLPVEGGQKEGPQPASLQTPASERGLSEAESKIRKKELKAELKRKKKEDN